VKGKEVPDLGRKILHHTEGSYGSERNQGADPGGGAMRAIAPPPKRKIKVGRKGKEEGKVGKRRKNGKRKEEKREERKERRR